jgi:hypothetical protein
LDGQAARTTQPDRDIPDGGIKLVASGVIDIEALSEIKWV